VPRRVFLEEKIVSGREFCSNKTLALLINSILTSNHNKRGQNALSRRRVVRDEVELTKPGGKETYPGRKGVLLAGLISAFEIYSRGLYPLNRLRFVTGCKPGLPSKLDPHMTRHLGKGP
jgi:hypothetical protein